MTQFVLLSSFVFMKLGPYVIAACVIVHLYGCPRCGVQSVANGGEHVLYVVTVAAPNPEIENHSKVLYTVSL